MEGEEDMLRPYGRAAAGASGGRAEHGPPSG